MNDTGLPSPFIDIMMFSPALRTSHNAFCACGVDDAHDRVGKAQVAHELGEALQTLALREAVFAREFDQQNRFGLADQSALDDRTKRGVGARQLDHGAIDELDGGRSQLDDVLRRRHRRLKRWES